MGTTNRGQPGERVRPSRLRVWLAAVVAVCALAGEARPSLGRTSGNPTVEAAVHLKIMSFDRTLRDEGVDRYVVGIAYDLSSGESRSAAHELLAAMNHLVEARRITVHGRPVSTVLVGIEPQESPEFTEGQVSVLILSDAMGSLVSRVTASAHEVGIGTLCGQREYLGLGAAVAVVVMDGKSRIVVNLAAARSAGMQLDPRLLSLAEVLER